MKTAISIPNEIFEELTRFAKEYHYSRSELFTLAIKNYLEKMKSQKLLTALNETYSETEPIEDTLLRQKTKKYYSKKILKEPY